MKAFLKTGIICSSIIILSFGCTEDDKSKVKDSKVQNTKVIYSVDFPFIEDPTLLKWFPTEYTTIFNSNEIYGEMNSKMNVICNRFYADYAEKKLFQSLENLSGKFKCKLNESDVNSVIMDMPEMMISDPIGDTIIVGVICKKAMAEFKQDSVPAVTLYYTDEFKVESPNWFNQYKELDAFLMGYEIEQFGMRMKLMAKEISTSKTEIKPVKVYGEKGEKAYSEVDPKKLQSIIKTMLNDFME